MNTNKIFTRFIPIFILLFFSLCISIQANDLFSFRFSGGMSYFINGDLNEGLIGQVNHNTDVANLFNYDITGHYSPLHYGINLKTDFLINISKNFGFGIGYEFGRYTNISSITYSNSFESLVHSIEPYIDYSAYFSELFYTIFFSNKLSSSLFLGVGYYFANTTSTMILNIDSQYTEYNINAKSDNLGLIGEFNIEWRPIRFLGVSIGISGRFLKLKELNGSSCETIGTYKFDNNGTLIYYEQESWYNNKLYPYITILDIDLYPLESSGFKNARKAIIDLSGACINFGIRIYI